MRSYFKYFTSSIPLSFYLIFFATPLVFYTRTSELFEFNKMLLVYSLTTYILGAWAIKCIYYRRIIFQRTILDIPIILFLVSQTLSTIFSIDTRTSLLGYYSRFHGGLTSSITYTALYWAFVSNLNKKNVHTAIFWSIVSAFIVSVYGILEHFGASPSCLFITKQLDTNCWVQDVQTRVFATLGQPNWMAAWLVSIVPITWVFITKRVSKNKALWVTIFILMLTALLYTKSRSGLLGFIAANAIFWTFHLTTKRSLKKILPSFLVIQSVIVLTTLLVGTPWTPNLTQLINKTQTRNITPSAATTVLETGGTGSSEIRKIVWQGAINIFKAHPLVGTGTETFAYSYYKFRPQQHNLVSEWNYLYNKAHNEYLNILANNGIVGLTSYLLIPLTFAYWFIKRVRKSPLQLALAAGYASILISNFFGFSVVPVAINFFLFPASVMVLSTKRRKELQQDKQTYTTMQSINVIIILCITLFTLFSIGRYWYADTQYRIAKDLNNGNEYIAAVAYAQSAVNITPREPIFQKELAESLAGLSLISYGQKDTEQANQILQASKYYADRAVTLSPNNPILRRSQANIYAQLLIIQPELIQQVISALQQSIALAPTEPRSRYSLALAYAKVGQKQNTIDTLLETIQLKPNYVDARATLAKIYLAEGQLSEAQKQIDYILINIDPDNHVALELREETKKLETK